MVRSITKETRLYIHMLLLCVAVLMMSSGMALAQATTTLVPTSYTTTMGTDGGQPVGNLATLQETGTGNNWNDYVEFQTQYAGYQLFSLPTTISPSQVTAIQIEVNYQGPSAANQTWTWQLYDWATSSYVTVGTNTGAPQWGSWQILKLNATGTLANYVRASDGQIKVQLVSNNSSDSADIDYEAVNVTYASATTLVPTSYTTTMGTDGGQPVGNLATLQETGTGNNWNDYVEFQTQYAGYQLFSLPTTISPSQVTAIQIEVNYQGPSAANQTWTWQLYDWATSSYVTVGTNTGAPQWGSWQILKLNATGTLANYVRASDGQIKVQLVSNNSSDSADIDYEAVNVTSSSSPGGTALAVTTTSLSGGTVGTAYSATLAASGGTSPYTWAITSGSLPAGVALTASSGALSGTPTTAGTFSFTAQATDSASPAHTATANLSIAVSPSSAYYVSPTGNDANSGSASAPWLTIGHAALQATAGDTVYVEAGTYHESVTFANSGTATAPIVFDGQGVAIVDGTGVACCTSPSFVSSNGFIGGNTQGLFTIGASSGVNYLTIQGFTIQNYKTASSANAPVGVFIVGSGTGISVLNNTIQNIQTTAGASGNAYGMGVFGTSATPLSVTVSGNTVTGCLTGNSETTTYNGNVQNFVVSNNKIYDNDNIGMDAIGFEGVGPTGYDQAKNGDVYGNLIYNITSNYNPAYGSGKPNNSLGADGLYCDGCTLVTFERNTLYGNDINIEAASETLGKVSSNVIIRNNLIYASNATGITVGGYNSGSTGGSTNITIVNNSLYDNDIKNTGSGEFQLQYRATGIVFENNIVHASTQGVFIYGFVAGSGLTANYNDYYTTGSTTTFELNGTSYSSFASYQSATGQDVDSVFANPDYLNSPTCTASGAPIPITTCTPMPNFDLSTGSPALNTGDSSLGTSDFGTVDFNGNLRLSPSGQINMGAYEQ